jgi:hypothetical protein
MTECYSCHCEIPDGEVWWYGKFALVAPLTNERTGVQEGSVPAPHVSREPFPGAFPYCQTCYDEIKPDA